MPGRISQGPVLWLDSPSCASSVLSLFCLLVQLQMGVLRLPVCASSFDIREHLSTKVPYIHRVRIRGAPSLYDTPDPPGYKPVFMYLLARHGSRWPTEKRMRQINSLKHLFQSVHNPHHPWMRNWTSPVADLQYLAGDLHPLGESEMLDLARRLRHRFPGLTDTYAPRRYPIISTQVPRAAQSASAFSIGFFSHPKHIQPLHQPQQQQQQQHGPSSSSSSGCDDRSWLPQPVAINMLPKRRDPVLRFFESCRAYREHEDRAIRWLAPWMHNHWHKVIPGLEFRLGVKPGSLNACHVDALWQLCAFEAGLGQIKLGSNGGSSRRRSKASGDSNVCQLFTQEDAQLLEWLEDVRLYETQGYGAAINYEIAAPLLADIATALTSAASADAAGRLPLQRARLMFAHCETLTPLASLMGLFKPAREEVSVIPKMPADAVLRAAIGTVDEWTEQQLDAADGVDDLPLVMMESETVAAVTPAAAEQQQPQQSDQRLQPSKRRKLISAAGSSSSISVPGSNETPTGSTHSSPGTSTASQAHSSSSSSSTRTQHQQQQPTKHHHGPMMEGCSYKGRETLDTSMLLAPPEGWSPGFDLDDLDRVWRGGRVAPLGANLLLVLYARSDASSSSSSSGGGGSDHLQYSDYRVRLVYNEQVIPIPGCGNGLECSLDHFLRFVIGGKASKGCYKKWCSAEDDHPGLAAAAAGGAKTQQIVYGSMLAVAEGSSSSSSTSSSSSEWIWGGELEQRETESGLELVTADGLPLLLTDEFSSSGLKGGIHAHKLWY